MASSDSDFEEVRRAWIIDQRGEPLEISLPPESPDEEGRVVSRRDTGAATDTALGQVAEALPGGSWRDEVLDALRTDYAAGGLMEGFARWMARLFAGTELVLIDPQDPVLMQCARPLIRRELETAAETEQLLAERSNELESAGFVPQVEHLPGETGLFLLDQHGRREKIARHGDGFLLRHSGTELSGTELLTIADVTPERCGPSTRTCCFRWRRSPAVVRKSHTALRSPRCSAITVSAWRRPIRARRRRC